MTRVFFVTGVFTILILGCSQSPPLATVSGNLDASSEMATVANEYPVQLLGKFADRPCVEANTIQQAADLWPGFEVKKFERSEQALLCAATSVRAGGGGFDIDETCLVRQANQQALRKARYELKGEQLSVTADGKTTVYTRCP